MGIESFYGKFIKPNYNDCIESTIPMEVASLFIDCNGIFHDSAQRVYGYGGYKGENSPNVNKLCVQVIKTLRDVVNTCKPKHNLIIAPDGVATVAKMNQQKSRRYNAAKQRTEQMFDSNQFTPGTGLMIRLDRDIESWIKSKADISAKRVIYSSHLDPGEGEHKIFQFIRENKILPGSGAHILYGMDSDLIILSLLSDLKGIYLMREDYSELINIDRLRERIVDDFMFDGGVRDRIIKDFSVICMFAGNDFLPKLPSYTDISSFLEEFTNLYKSNARHLITADENIDFAVMKNILLGFTRKEEALLTSIIMEKKHRYPYPELSQCVDKKTGTLNKERFVILWYCKQFCPASGKLATFYENHQYYTNEDVGDMVVSFLKTCQWVYKYYTAGFKSVSNTHFYPYFYAPFGESIFSILNIIFTEPSRRVNRLNKLYDVGNQNNIEITAGHQLLAVIPPKSAGIIPNELTAGYKAVSMLSPTEFNVKHEGTNTDWHVTVVIPPVNIYAINAAMDYTNSKVPVELMDKESQMLDKEVKFKKTTDYSIRYILNLN